MVATAAFVIGFILIGLAVFFVAMAGGPAGAREQLLHNQSRAGNRANGVIIALVIVVVGLGVPGVVMVVNASDRAASAPGGVDLTSAQEDGRQVFAEQCATCHQLNASNAVGRVGPNLDELRPPAALTLDAIKVGRARGMGQMPAELVEGEDAENVADYVEAVAGRR